MCNFETKLFELSQLDAGWLDGSGKIIDRHCLDITKEIFKSNVLSRLQNIDIFPTEYGNIVIEAQFNTEWNIGIYILPRHEVEVTASHRKNQYNTICRTFCDINHIAIVINSIS